MAEEQNGISLFSDLLMGKTGMHEELQSTTHSKLPNTVQGDTPSVSRDVMRRLVLISQKRVKQ